MKKLTAISILLVLLSVSAFAQLKVGFSSRFVTDAVFFEQATGTNADDEPDKAEGAFNLFSTSGLIGNKLRLDFKYTADHFEGYLEVKGDSLVTRGAKFLNEGASFLDIVQANFGDYYVKGNGWVFTGYAGNTDNRGKVGTTYEYDKFTDFIDNKLNHLGVIRPANIFTNGFGSGTTYVPYKWASGQHQEQIGEDGDGNPIYITVTDYANAGMMKVSKAFVTYADIGGLVGSNSDTDNLKMADSPYISLGLDLSALSIPVVVEVASNAAFAGWYNHDKNVMGSMTMEDGRTYPGPYTASASSVYGTFRVGGGKFIDMISFDAIYRINGNDPNTREQNNAKVTSWWYNRDQYLEDGGPSERYPSNSWTTNFAGMEIEPLDGGSWSNEIGLYAGIDLFKGLGLAAGYTAAFKVDEKYRIEGDDITTDTVEIVNPVYNGISLNANLSLIPNLDLTLNNNVSFAWQTGTDSANKAIATSGSDLISFMTSAWSLNDKQKDSWFALWNTLGAKYNITERASVSAEVSNRLSIYEFIGDTEHPGDYFAKVVTDNIQFGVSGAYAFSSNVSFGAGLNVSIWGTEVTGKDADGTTWADNKIGEVRLAMPILFTVSF